MIVFIRCRHTFSYGDQPWEYKDFEFDDDATEEEIEETIRSFVVDEFYEEYAYAEKRHTVEWDRVTAPPIKWLQKEIENAEELIEYNQWRRDLLQVCLGLQVPPEMLQGEDTCDSSDTAINA